ncbi:hypothetical protein QCA50_009064 [Cerrena zonata]|uniref:Uncharacterized protein n=1 Tax=Cerrena zonata TaxID=2478898 RepID=A0AAW0G9M9_9APHY
MSTELCFVTVTCRLVFSNHYLRAQDSLDDLASRQCSPSHFIVEQDVWNPMMYIFKMRITLEATAPADVTFCSKCQPIGGLHISGMSMKIITCVPLIPYSILGTTLSQHDCCHYLVIPNGNNILVPLQFYHIRALDTLNMTDEYCTHDGSHSETSACILSIASPAQLSTRYEKPQHFIQFRLAISLLPLLHSSSSTSLSTGLLPHFSLFNRLNRETAWKLRWTGCRVYDHPRYFVSRHKSSLNRSVPITLFRGAGNMPSQSGFEVGPLRY